MVTAVHQMVNVAWLVPTTSGLEISGPSGCLVILSLLGSAVSTVDFKRKTAKIVAVHEVSGGPPN